MALRHVAALKWSRELTESETREINQAMDLYVSTAVQPRSYSHGPDIGGKFGTFDYVLIADFDSEDEFLAFNSDPLHDAVRAVLAGKVAKAEFVQFDTEWPGDRT
ncbi:hypothetical protein ACFT9I_39980 [Streptomyces sp. NPDC057137]|uniref:hypothetical protein n=1 Tax=Streptomyces sp. NPDC057137 TaxID=3346030 RepID=UPI003634D51F